MVQSVPSAADKEIFILMQPESMLLYLVHTSAPMNPILNQEMHKSNNKSK
jgi:D-alanyl-D-alanine carboxypeptidase